MIVTKNDIRLNYFKKKYGFSQKINLERIASMIYEKQEGVPKFECTEYSEKSKDYVVLNY